MAIRSARKVINTVPYKDVAAPNDSLTGSQSVEIRNPTIPNFSMAGKARENNTYRIPIIRSGTDIDATAVTVEKVLSIGSLLGDFGKIIQTLY
jgi:hypothetical protein